MSEQPPVTVAGEAAEHRPTSQDIALLKQWNVVQSGFRRLYCQLLADVEAQAGVAPSSFQVLWFLLTSPGRTAQMHQLTRTLGFSTAGTTRVADRLTAAGLIQRSSSPADRRVVNATLTEEGTRVATAAAVALADALRGRLADPGGVKELGILAAAFTTLSSHGYPPP